MSSSDLKRVGLIYTADGVADFKRSLSDVNNELAKNKNEFKRATLAYDENTKASEKLADRQKFLSKQFEAQKEKVKSLERSLEDYSKSEGANENQIKKKTLAIEKAKTELVKYEVDLKSVSKEVEKGTADFKELAKKIDDVGDKMKATGSSMSRNITAPILGAGAASIIAFQTIDEAYDNIITKTGATGQELEGLTAVFDSIYGNFPFETAEVSEAVGEVSTRFGLQGDELEAASLKFLEFANINNTDVTTAVASVSRSLQAANEPLSEYQTLLDIATTASQKSGISVDSLFASYEQYGSQLRTVGFDMAESIALLAQTEKSGMNVENVFAALKTANKNWAKSGKDAREEFSLSVEAIKNAKTETEALQIATETFGSKAAVEFTESIRTGRFEIDDMTKALSDYAGSTSTTFESTLDPIDESKIAMNNLTLSGAELGKEIQNALGPIFETLSQTLKDVTDWFKGLDDSTKRVILIILAIVAAVGPILVIFGTLASSISSLIGLWGIISGVMAGTAGAAFVGLLPIIGGVVLAVMAVIAIGKLVVDNWEWISTKASEIWTTVSTFFSNMFTSIGTMFTNFLNAGVSLFTKLWEGIKNVFISFISGGIPGLINDYIMKPFFGIDLFEVGVNIINGLWSGISSMVGSLFDGIKGIAGGLIDSAKQALDINSPSKEFEKIGAFTGEGFALGLQSSISDLNNQVFAMADNSISAFSQGEVVHNHTGVIRVEGIDNQGQMNTVVDILMDRLRKEVRK